jgi:hypothetical protein
MHVYRVGGCFQLLQFCEHKSALYPMAFLFLLIIGLITKLHIDAFVLTDTFTVVIELRMRSVAFIMYSTSSCIILHHIRLQHTLRWKSVPSRGHRGQWN